MQAQRSQSLDTIIGRVNSVLSREVTLSASVTDPLTRARTNVRRPAASVYPPQPNRPETVAVETPWGYFLPIARIEIDRVTVSHEKVEATAKALTLKLGVPVSFEPTPGGGPLQLWVPKIKPDPSYWFDAYNTATFGPLAGVVGVDRRNVPVIVDLNQGVDRHMVILGPTTAGKSVIADMFLLSMCLRTAPDMLRLVIFDCKSKAHESWRGLPHTALYEGGGERNKQRILAGIAALERLMDERQETGVTQPVIVALFDDGREPEGWSPDYKATMGKLLRIGASAGIRVIITAHELKEDWAGEASRSNLNTRIVSGNDVFKTASQVGMGGSQAHQVDQTLRQFVLKQNNQTRTFYAPHLCQPGQFLDINRKGRDDVLEAIKECNRRYEPGPLLGVTVVVPEQRMRADAFAVSVKGERNVGGVTFSDAVSVVAELLANQPDARQADCAEAIWGQRRVNGTSQVTFLKEVMAQAREEIEDVTTD
jgi:hypothetical protein